MQGLLWEGQQAREQEMAFSLSASLESALTPEGGGGRRFSFCSLGRKKALPLSRVFVYTGAKYVYIEWDA